MTLAPLSWTGGRLDGTPWQGIRYLSIEFDQGGEFPATVTAHLNRPAGSLTPDDVVIGGGRSIAPPAHEISIAGNSIEVRFRGYGDHSPYTVEIGTGGGIPVHPFFSSAEFRFTIDCAFGDCRDPVQEATRLVTQPPAVDLLTKDYNGFVQLLSDWVKIKNPSMVDLSAASMEQMLLELLAWMGDMLSYQQDRVAGEAFLETARQRFSMRQHALLLGTAVDDGAAPTTLLAADVEFAGFLPAGLQVRTRTSPDEAPVVFTVAERTAVRPEHDTTALRVAAFPDATDAVIVAGATELLLWGQDDDLQAGDQLAFVQGTFSQVVTLVEPPRRLEEPGWVADPADAFDPVADPPAAVTRLRWAEPLLAELAPWGAVPLAIHGNLVPAAFGAPRRALAGTPPTQRHDIVLELTPRNSIVVRDGDAYRLRALRVPEWPVVHDRASGEATAIPAVDVVISDQRWTRVEHFHASRSYDLHFTAEADEAGAVWLRFGDGVLGREVPLEASLEPAVPLVIEYRTGDAVAGNVGLGTLVDVVRPRTGTDELVALETLGDVAVTNVLPASGGRAAHTLPRTREDLRSSLRHGPLQRAVALQDYAAVAMEVPGVARATVRALGGLFNTVLVLVDPAGSEDLDDALRDEVHAHLDSRRMAGREHIVQAADYVPLEVELVLCAQPGVERSLVRDRVLAELRPGTDERPGWFHPDRLSFGDAVRLGDVLAFVQSIAGVRSVKATRFRPLGDATGPEVRDVITLGSTNVARLDADPDFPENGTLLVRAIGLDGDPAVLAIDGAVAV